MLRPPGRGTLGRIAFRPVRRGHAQASQATLPGKRLRPKLATPPASAEARGRRVPNRTATRTGYRDACPRSPRTSTPCPPPASAASSRWRPTAVTTTSPCSSSASPTSRSRRTSATPPAAPGREDRTNYTPNGGIAPLREALVDEARARERRSHVDVEQVWVTVGATQALHQAMGLTLGARRRGARARPRLHDLHDERPHARARSRAVPAGARARVRARPRRSSSALRHRAHPGDHRQLAVEPARGRSSGEAMLRALLAFAKRHDLWVISDEVYEYFTYGTAARQPGGARRRTTACSASFSLSKTYAMTGVRVGYLVTPKGLADDDADVQEATISCVAEPDQYAALAAIVGDHQRGAPMRASTTARTSSSRRRLLDERGIGYLDPSGAFYLWIDVVARLATATSPSGPRSSCCASASPSRRAARSAARARAGSACASPRPRTTSGAASARCRLRRRDRRPAAGAAHRRPDRRSEADPRPSARGGRGRAPAGEAWETSRPSDPPEDP